MPRELGAPSAAGQPAVSVEICYVDDVECYSIKISTAAAEVNVVVTPAEAAKLGRVRETPWLSGALQIGKSAGAPAWWSIGEEQGDPYLSLLIGSDDQTWDIGFTLPLGTMDSIGREVATCERPQEG